MAKKPKTYFYHSFPRGQPQKIGLKVLESILQKGLLVTAECKIIPGCSGLRSKKFIQRRVSFTALTPDGLKSHARKFGPFSLEFEPKTLREFGALPAVYLSAQIPSGQLLHNGGDELARHLLLVHDVLRRLRNLHDKGTGAQKRLAANVLKKIKPEKKTVQELFFTAQTLLNLYYPTDDPKWTSPLGYYEQREWKITPNIVMPGVFHFHKLTTRERRDLIAVNPFFKKQIQGRSRAALSYRFEKVGSSDVVASARRIIVPDSLVTKCREIVNRSGRCIPVVAASTVT